MARPALQKAATRAIFETRRCGINGLLLDLHDALSVAQDDVSKAVSGMRVSYCIVAIERINVHICRY